MNDEPALEVMADDGVLEAYGAAVRVGYLALVEYLEEYVHYVGVSLLYLIEKYHGIGLAAYLFSELTSLVVA